MLPQPGDILGVHGTFAMHISEMCKSDLYRKEALRSHTSNVQAGCLLLTLTPWAILSTKGRLEEYTEDDVSRVVVQPEAWQQEQFAPARRHSHPTPGTTQSGCQEFPYICKAAIQGRWRQCSTTN